MKRMLFAVSLLALVLPSVSFAADLYSNPSFMSKCAMCHGKAGEGKPAMKIKPMKEYAASADMATLKGVITNGKPPMMKGAAAYGLSPAQVDALVAGIQALK